MLTVWLVMNFLLHRINHAVAVGPTDVEGATDGAVQDEPGSNKLHMTLDGLALLSHSPSRVSHDKLVTNL